MVVLIFAGARVLTGVLDRPELVLPWVVFVVGEHFVPLCCPLLPDSVAARHQRRPERAGQPVDNRAWVASLGRRTSRPGGRGARLGVASRKVRTLQSEVVGNTHPG